MADDRIYLRCKICKKALFLGKRLGFEYYWKNYGKMNNHAHRLDPFWKMQDERPLEDRLNEFFETHFECAMDAPDEIDFYFPNVFDIVYETDDDFCKKVNFGGGTQ